MSDDRIPPDIDIPIRSEEITVSRRELSVRPEARIVVDPSLPSGETPLVLGADPAGSPALGWTVRERVGVCFINPRALRVMMGVKRVVVKTFDDEV